MTNGSVFLGKRRNLPTKFDNKSLQNPSKHSPAKRWIERHRSRWVWSGSSCVLPSSPEQCPRQDVYQPKDHLGSVGSLGVGDRTRRLQHCLGRGGHQSGTARPEDAARGCFSSLERDVCTLQLAFFSIYAHIIAQEWFFREVMKTKFTISCNFTFQLTIRCDSLQATTWLPLEVNQKSLTETIKLFCDIHCLAMLQEHYRSTLIADG